MAVGSRPELDTKSVSTNPKSIWVAYLLWLFLGIIAAHRFYLRRNGWLQLFTVLLFGIGLIWVLVDVFLIPGMVRRNNKSGVANRPSSKSESVLKFFATALVAILGLGAISVMTNPEGVEDWATSVSRTNMESGGDAANKKHPTSDKFGDASQPRSSSKKYAEFNETVAGRRISTAVLSASTSQRAGLWIMDEFFGETAQPGAVFVIIEYEYTNISDGPISAFNSPTIKLVSPAGVEFNSDSGATAAEKTSRNIQENFLSDLNPLITYRSLEVFEIAELLYGQPGWEIKVELDRGEYYVRISKQ